MIQSLQKVFNLINKTGDRCIVLNPDNGDAYAIMSLPEYERVMLGRSEISDLTEDELLDKINRDIAVWKSLQSNEQIAALSEEARKSANVYQKLGSNYLANTSKNSTPPDNQWDIKDRLSDFENDYEDLEDTEEEPYYFEKV